MAHVDIRIKPDDKLFQMTFNTLVHSDEDLFHFCRQRFFPAAFPEIKVARYNLSQYDLRVSNVKMPLKDYWISIEVIGPLEDAMTVSEVFLRIFADSKFLDDFVPLESTQNADEASSSKNVSNSSVYTMKPSDDAKLAESLRLHLAKFLVKLSKDEFNQNLLVERFKVIKRDIHEDNGRAGNNNDLRGTYWFSIFKDLAMEYNVKGGHWNIFFAPPTPVEEEAQEITVEQWDKFAQQLKSRWLRLFWCFLKRELSQCSTSVCAKRSRDGYALAAHNRSFLGNDLHSVFVLEKALRLTGVARPLKYKPDVYSACGITHDNDLCMRPTILKSVCDQELCRSMIEPDYTKEYTPELDFGEGMVWYNNWRPEHVFLRHF